MMTTQLPRLDRTVDLRLLGDWGMANFHRVCGWLAQEIGSRTPRGSRFATYNGTGGSDAFFRLHERDVDIAVTTPAAFATLAPAGKGPYAGCPMDDLRALAVLPQRDRLTFAIDPALGITTFAELRAAKPPLRISVCTAEDGNLIGYATAQLLEACGLSHAELAAWGGELIAFDKPDQCLAFAQNDRTVGAVVQEAIMTPWWRELIAARDFRILSIEQSAVDRLKASLGWQPAVLEAGYFIGLEQPATCMDFSDFLVFTHADLPDDVAHLAAWVLTETRELFERQYRHMPADRSPLTYPLDPAKMGTTPIPLHPGAREHYRAAGYIR